MLMAPPYPMPRRSPDLALACPLLLLGRRAIPTALSSQQTHTAPKLHATQFHRTLTKSLVLCHVANKPDGRGALPRIITPFFGRLL
jgi:hypothetical protein